MTCLLAISKILMKLLCSYLIDRIHDIQSNDDDIRPKQYVSEGVRQLPSENKIHLTEQRTIRSTKCTWIYASSSSNFHGHQPSLPNFL